VVPSTSATPAPSTTAAPGKIPCSSADDCWVDDSVSPYQPIARPKRLRGKRFRPCVDGEAAPVCRSGFCGVEGYFC
jgi:hypothetical protein